MSTVEMISSAIADEIMSTTVDEINKRVAELLAQAPVLTPEQITGCARIVAAARGR